MMNHWKSSTSACALLIALGGANLAQSQTPTQPPAAASSSTSTPGVETTQLGDIVVTATRRAENLQDVPIAVTSISGSDVSGAGVTDTRQLMQLVPGFTGSRNLVGIQPAIRGVTSSGVSIGDEGNIAFYVDGVYQPDPYANAADLVAVERVEVLRGPQGTLFGRNATGGLINIITKDPRFDTNGQVSVELGRFRRANEGAFRFYGNTGLTDTLAANVAILARGNEGYIKDLYRGKDQGKSRVFDIRGKLLYQPNDAFKAVLTGSYGYMNDNSPNSASAYVNASGNALVGGAAVPGAIVATEPFTTATDIEGIIRQHKSSASLRTSFDLGPAALETTSAYWHSKTVQQTDTDTSTAGITSNRVEDIVIEAYSQEIRLLSDNDSNFKWIVGGFYFHEDGSALLNAFNGAPPYTAPLSPNLPVARIMPKIGIEAYAVFAEGTYTITPAFQVTLGGRQSFEDRHVESTVIRSTVFSAENDTDSKKFTWRASAQYELVDRTNVYLTYSTGFKSGVFNSFFFAANAAALASGLQPTRPETIEGFELGVKSDLTSRLRLNLALFDYNYKDLQVNARAADGASYILQNAARAKLRGIEAEGFAQLTNTLNLRIAAAYLDAKYRSFPGAQTYEPITIVTSPTLGGTTVVAADVSGNRLTRAPEFTLSGGLTWDHETSSGRLGANINAFYTTKVFQDFANNFAIPAHEMINAEISFAPANTNLKLALWTTNLTNQIVYQQIQVGAHTYVNYEKPRRVGLRVSYDF